MAPQVQVQRTAEGCWQFTRVVELRRHVYQYDVVARVVIDEDDGLYYVERAYWERGEQHWQRRQRGYQLFRGAERAASDFALGKVEGS